MRVIAVGDDDQNIYEFRGSDSGYLYLLRKQRNGSFIEMAENYRSARHIVDFANGFATGIGNRMKSLPIVSMRENEGRVEVIRHRSGEMYRPIVDELVMRRNEGTSCVLTQTNDEAVILTALLRRNRLDCRLIQSLDGFSFWKVAEVRYFLRHLEKRCTAPVIADELWEDAKRMTSEKYRTSRILPLVMRCVEMFEQTTRAKYLGDFKEFLFESSVEDFCDISGEGIVVSTIHKAKGREFDNVYMLVSADRPMDDSLRRRYYVGMTRARNFLSVHTNAGFFSHLNADACIQDDNEYPMPEEVVLQLSHKDVNLGFFEKRKREILEMRSGDMLSYRDCMLHSATTGLPVAKLSAKMQKTLSEWEGRGYRVQSAEVRFVVAWKPKEAPKGASESAVLLADMTLRLADSVLS